MLHDAGAWLAEHRLPTRSSLKDYYKQYKAVNISIATRLVLTPFDGVEIHTFLHELPKRAQLAKESDTLLHRLEHVVDLGISCEAANTEPDTGVRALVTAAECAKDV